MPTYDYECDACGHRFEEFQQMSDSALKTCPKCRKRKLRRLVGSGSAVLFKGSGFYQTDYRSKQYRDQAKSETAAPSAPKDSAGATARPSPCATCPNAKKSEGKG